MDDTTRSSCSRSPVPAEILSAIPLFLGYPPTDSLVCLFFDPEGRMVLSSRLDWQACRADPETVVRTLSERASSGGARSVFIVEVDTPAPDPATLVALALQFLMAGIGVEWAGRSAAGSWQGLDCDPRCPPHPVDPHSAMVVELVTRGWSAVPDRDCLIGEVAAADPIADLGPALAPGPDLEAWRDAAIDELTVLLQTDRPLTADDIDLVARVCRDIRARDVVLWRLECTPAGRAVTRARRWQVFATTLRRAPADAVAPVAAVAALMAWQAGEGTRATACLDRARAADPGHSLSGLIRSCLDQAVSPSVWLASLSSLDEDTCRHGAAD
ncbi:MAG: DUF4192 family protein [Candidatus Nanopelagicales bacterium]